MGNWEDTAGGRTGYFIAGDGSKHWTSTPPRPGWVLSPLGEWVAPPGPNAAPPTTSSAGSIWDDAPPGAWEPATAEVFGSGQPGRGSPPGQQGRRAKRVPPLLARWVGGCLAALLLIVGVRLLVPESRPEPRSKIGDFVDEFVPGMGDDVDGIIRDVEKQIETQIEQQSGEGGERGMSQPASGTASASASVEVASPVPFADVAATTSVAPLPEPAPADPPTTYVAEPVAPQVRTSFGSCAEARAAGAAGAAPLYTGEPGYSTSLDRDGDGAACE